MPRSADYYSQPQQSAPRQGYSSPLLDSNQAPAQPTSVNDPKFVAAGNRGFWSLFGEGLRDTITGQKFIGENDQMQQARVNRNWDEKGNFEKASEWIRGTKGLLWNVAKAVPGTIVKGGVNVAYDVGEVLDTAQSAVFGTKTVLPEKFDLSKLYQNAKLSENPLGFVLDRTNFFGAGHEVSGFKMTYNQSSESIRNAWLIGDGAKKIGADKLFGAVMTTGKVVGDLLIANMLRTAITGAFKPSAVKVQSLGAVDDIRPLTPTNLSQVKSKIADISGGKYKPTLNFDQDSNAMMLRLPQGTSPGGGLPKGNYALRFTPAGKGSLTADVVQLRNSAVSRGIDWMKAKFGTNNVIETKFGPAVKIRTGIVEYDPTVIAKSGDTLPSWLQTTKSGTPALQVSAAEVAPSATGVVPNAAPAVAGNVIQPATGVPAPAEPAKPDGTGPAMLDIRRAAEDQLGQEAPRVMAKPIKGFEEKIVDTDQIGQILRIQQDRGLSDGDVFAINKTLTGKNSLGELTQAEAYNVSETLRMFGQESPIRDTSSVLPSYTHPARYWVDPEIYYPIEQGYRLANMLTDKLNTTDAEILGKYTSPQFYEERRMISQYAEGNTKVITDNPALDDNTKAELIKISEQVIEKFKNMHTAGEIQSTAYVGKYVPNIRKLDFVAARYKDLENIPGLKPFFEFMRKGSDTPLEDDIAVIMQVYNKAFATSKFLQQPFRNSETKIGSMNSIDRRATTDYLQEKLGYQGTAEKYLNNWGQKISEKTNGNIPASVLRDVFNKAMKYSYAATLGFRPMAVFSQLTQALVMNYAEFGDDMLSGFKTLLNKNLTKDFKESGYLPRRGDQRPVEPATNPLLRAGQKAIAGYDWLNDISMKGFSWSDGIGRQAAYFNFNKRFNESYVALQKGDISYEQFEKNIRLDGYAPALQKMVRTRLATNTKESILEAKNFLTMQTLDTGFLPSRKGTESRAFYGMKGQAGLQFASYPFEMVHTVGEWVKRSQWDKLIRFLAMSTVLKRAADDLGINLNNALVFGSFAAAPVGPLANAIFELIKIPFANNSEEIDGSAEEVAKALINYGGVGVGIEKNRLQDFKYSMEMFRKGHPAMPDPMNPEAKYGIYSAASGKLKQTVTFSDLLKYGMNIPLSSTADWSSKVKQEVNANKSRQEIIDSAVKELVNENFEKFNRIVTENQIQIGDISEKMKSYDVPLDYRMFQRMPTDLKQRFYPLFTPNE